MFHVLNKRAASVVGSSPYFHQPDYESRRHVLLLGDNIGDLHMSDGVGFDEIIRVGFLNDRVEQRMEEYKANFDVRRRRMVFCLRLEESGGPPRSAIATVLA